MKRRRNRDKNLQTWQHMRRVVVCCMMKSTLIKGRDYRKMYAKWKTVNFFRILVFLICSCFYISNSCRVAVVGGRRRLRSLNFGFYRIVDPFLSFLRVWSWNLNSFRQKSLSPPRTARLLERAGNRLEGRQRLIHFNLFSTSHFNFIFLSASHNLLSFFHYFRVHHAQRKENKKKSQ